ncbi:MAG: hypothetical protein KF784_02670 [Fimbriimonadaceae bacterium]|nr:hypothetical protein [Fimbriimonadaceae bacterium]
MRLVIVGCKESDNISQDDIVLSKALASRGVDAHRAVWSDPNIDWAQYDLAVIRTTWDYHLAPQQFLEWINYVSRTTRILNTPQVIRWNIHKGYLRELESKGVPTVPTLICKQDSTAVPPEAQSWGRIVVKPAISASAHATIVTDFDSPEAEAHLRLLCKQGDALVQPFLSAILEGYEISLVYIDGEFTHAVRKWPGAGDFRVQVDHGGRYESAIPTESEKRVGDLAMSACDFRPLFARVDVCRTAEGEDVVMELELIEPELWLSACPEALERLCRAIEQQAQLAPQT